MAASGLFHVVNLPCYYHRNVFTFYSYNIIDHIFSSKKNEKIN